MRAAALDYGKVRIGVAVADDLAMFAHARPPIPAAPSERALVRIADLANEEEIDVFIIGLPLRLSGVASVEAARVVTFSQNVARVTGRKVDLWDERFTTTQAHRQLRASGVSSRKGRHLVDGVAACILLQAWLDAQASSVPP